MTIWIPINFLYLHLYWCFYSYKFIIYRFSDKRSMHKCMVVTNKPAFHWIEFTKRNYAAGHNASIYFSPVFYSIFPSLSFAIISIVLALHVLSCIYFLLNIYIFANNAIKNPFEWLANRKKYKNWSRQTEANSRGRKKNY